MKKLIVFYSWGGNTRAIAKRFAAWIKADVCEIRTVKTYPDDYDVLASLAKKEVESAYMPQIFPVEADLDSYDAILLGTPVWWGNMAPAVRSFANGQDWRGKHVYPFVTDGGDHGRVFGELKRALRGARVEAGLRVTFDGAIQSTPESELRAWLGPLS